MVARDAENSHHENSVDQECKFQTELLPDENAVYELKRMVEKWPK